MLIPDYKHNTTLHFQQRYALVRYEAALKISDSLWENIKLLPHDTPDYIALHDEYSAMLDKANTYFTSYDELSAEIENAEESISDVLSEP